MEPTVLSGPLGHSQWESEQPFPLGFHTLGSDNGGVLYPNETGQTGFQDFTNSDHSQTCQQNEDLVYEDKPVELESLIHFSEFSPGGFKFEDDESAISQLSFLNTHIREFTDKQEGPEEASDCTLTLPFSPKLGELFGKTASGEVCLTQVDPLESSSALSSQEELISLSVPASPSKISETETVEESSLVNLLSDEMPWPPLGSSEEINSRDITEELVNLSQEQRAGLPPFQNSQTLSPETGDKGLFPGQVTDLLVTCSPPTQGSAESGVSSDHLSTSPLQAEGSVPLLDLAVPDTDGSLSLSPTSPGECWASSLHESEVKCTGEISNLTSELGENDSCAVDVPAETSALTATPAEDAFVPGEFSENCFVKDCKVPTEDPVCSEAKPQGNGAMASCLAAADVHNNETLDLVPQKGAQNGSDPDLVTEQQGEERLAGTDPSGGSSDFLVEDLLGSAPEEGRTSEQPVTISLSKMVADDSLPMVSAVNVEEADVSPLKAVFDALDQDGDGFVRIEEFMEFAAAYGADQVKDLTKFLDPSGLGVISFEDFHRGISAITNGGPAPQLYSVNYSRGDGAGGCPEEYDEQNEVTDSAYLGSESTYSECETFTDEDTGALVPPEMHEDVETDSGIEATLHDPEDGGTRFSLNSELHSHKPALLTVIGGEEEHFEDFGESNTSELLLESTVDGTEQPSDSHLLQTPEQVNGSSLLSPSAGKRLSSKKVARHLLQNSSMTLDTMSDLTRDIMELADNDITDKVLLLERRVAELEKESEASVEQHARLRQDNLHLVHRANALEEQLKEQEVQAHEQLQQESRRQKDATIKLEREREMELENLHTRLQQLDEENSELRSCVPCLRANIERLEEEKMKLQDERDTMADRLQEETEFRKKMGDKLSHERHQSQKEKEGTQELIEDLRKQLEHLQLYKLEAEAKRGRTPGAGLQEYQTRTREAELEQEIRRLKQDNRSLKDQNDELNGQIINLSIQGAKNLMTASFSDSLAAEINSVSRSELMEAVHKQEEINYRLQDYIDKIIVAIMESNPSILEVK
ncbi:rab11 family-interacting protein 3 isoform X2 [Takifugu flavidus]|uniref:rab11 family-interacting protein 3 isoform X2 n=1 Tax=Takifugu flavidus TaxID=433684 RepID=UPI0025447D82|nr:rab11 family-interacting protein 3 isoform X2 [Takifugu flavidus]